MTAQAVKYANDFITFLNNSPTPYHAVDSVKSKLVESGFNELSERVNWAGKVKKNGAYFVTRNNSSIIAFTVGGHWQPGNGVSIVGAHTDSPTLRIKPISHSTKEGFNQVGIETYGGGLWHTWFDRDLGVAGRVFIEEEESGNIVSKLVKIDKPVLRIPTLAIHLTKERAKFEFNKETQFHPISSLENSSEKEKNKDEEHDACAGEDLTTEEFKSIQSVVERHNKQLLDLVAADLDCSISQIVDFELILFDHNKPVLGGLNEEFVFSGRLDNLTSCFCATEALINASKDTNRLDLDTNIQLISLFDHEEIGSVSAQGADSSFLPDILQRITRLTGNEVSTDLEGQPNSFFLESMAKSFLLSSDMAHGVHPNYGEVYEKLNRPRINEGPVIKINANQRYSTNSPGIVLLKKIGELGKVPLQLFVVRNDSPCGSTIGPMLSAKLGLRTLDLGNPQLSMHSIRETGGARDVKKLVDLFESYFENYYTLEPKIKV